MQTVKSKLRRFHKMDEDEGLELPIQVGQSRKGSRKLMPISEGEGGERTQRESADGEGE